MCPRSHVRSSDRRARNQSPWEQRWGMADIGRVVGRHGLKALVLRNGNCLYVIAVALRACTTATTRLHEGVGECRRLGAGHTRCMGQSHVLADDVPLVPARCHVSASSFSGIEISLGDGCTVTQSTCYWMLPCPLLLIPGYIHNHRHAFAILSSFPSFCIVPSHTSSLLLVLYIALNVVNPQRRCCPECDSCETISTAASGNPGPPTCQPLRPIRHRLRRAHPGSHCHQE